MNCGCFELMNRSTINHNALNTSSTIQQSLQSPCIHIEYEWCYHSLPHQSNTHHSLLSTYYRIHHSILFFHYEQGIDMNHPISMIQENDWSHSLSTNTIHLHIIQSFCISTIPNIITLLSNESIKRISILIIIDHSIIPELCNSFTS